MPLTTEPNNWYDQMGCNFCSAVYQDLKPILNDDGVQVVNNEGRPLFEQDASAVMGEVESHISSWHKETDEIGEDGEPIREHMGELPPS